MDNWYIIFRCPDCGMVLEPQKDGDGKLHFDCSEHGTKYWDTVNRCSRILSEDQANQEFSTDRKYPVILSIKD